MRPVSPCLRTSLASIAVMATFTGGADTFPAWAFPACPSRQQSSTPDAERPLSVPGSGEERTEAQINNLAAPVDWFPLEHGPLPAIVASSHGPHGAACGFCHLPDGTGRPENAKLAGLPAAYIAAQVRTLLSGERRAAQADWAPTKYMAEFATNVADDDIAAAAEYYSRQRAQSFVEVQERRYVPAHELRCFMHERRPGPDVTLGQSILELPADFERFERRDPHTRYVAYVPPGSVERGRVLASTGGNGRTLACAACHGADLRGGAALAGPPIAGRFPGYLFRQLYAFRVGTRSGEAAQPMQAVVAGLAQADLIDLAAYAATLAP